MVPPYLMKISAVIRKRKGRRAYELTIPIELLDSLGWIEKKSKTRETKEFKNENHTLLDKIDVTLYPDSISKKTITVELNGHPQKGFYLKRMVEYRRNNQKEAKSYKQRIKDFKQSIKKKQIKSGFNKVNWNLDQFP